MPKITKQRWDEAQVAERQFHDGLTFDEGVEHYRQSYEQYFSYVGVDMNNLQKENIIEVGCADYPALSYCKNFHYGFIIEPMSSEYLVRIIDNHNQIMMSSANYPEDNKLLLITKTVEEMDMQEFPVDSEVWLFNVMQHILDPQIFLDKLKSVAKTIRFFEPINTDISVCHPQAYTLEYFQEQFGDCVKHYPHNPTAVNFHTWECAYGVWEKQ